MFNSVGWYVLIIREGPTSVIFLPRKAKTYKAADLDTAKVTMQVIAKYSRSKTREG